MLPIPRTAHSPQYPGDSRHVLARMETPSCAVGELRYAAGLCIARHYHDTANLIYILDGAHWSAHGRGGDRCLPGTVRFLPAGDAHENYFPVSSRCVGVELRPSLVNLAREQGATLCAPGEVALPRAPGLAARLRRELRRNDIAAPLSVDLLVLELLLAGVRSSPPRREPIPTWLLRVREMLHEEGTGRLTLAELARCAGRHPVQVSRQFHHHFGCTVGEYVRRSRVARAQLLLASGALSLAEIALACGFSDQSHFTTAFRRLAGVPPHRYRALGSSRRNGGAHTIPSVM